MEQSVAQLGARLSKIEMEYTVAARKRAESVSKAYRALTEISDEDVEMLRGVVPSLAIVKTFSEKDLLDNLHGEIASVKKASEELRTYVDHRLSFYEEHL